MKVLVLVRYWPRRSETFVAQEILGLMRRGHDVVVGAIGEGDPGLEVPVEVWRPPRGVAGPATWPAALLARAEHPAVWSWLVAQGRIKDATRAAWMGQRAREAGVQRVHVHFAGEAAEWGRLVSAMAGVPMSVTAHASDLFRPRPSLRAVLQAASPVVTVCAHHVRWIERHHGVQAMLVRCGVDPAAFSPDGSPRRARDLDVDGDLRLITVARWVPKKGLDDLLHALQMVHANVDLRLVSDPPRPLSDTRVRAGALQPDQVAAALTKADVFVLPCRIADDGDRDGVPVALMEAMASGLPVISTDVSGIPELVDDTVGWRVPAGDVSALATAIDAAADRPTRLERGHAARQRILQGWTIDHQVEGLLRAWGAA
jgi:glycosyltransferase involved in cell wall biosynthesis